MSVYIETTKGDPTNTGREGKCIYDIVYGGKENKYFKDEFSEDLQHNEFGLLSYLNIGKNTNTSKFFITTTDRHLDYLDNKNTIFGFVVEGLDIIREINNEITDDSGKPFKAIRILSTEVLIDPFENSKLNKDLLSFIPKENDLIYENSSNFIEENESNNKINQISEKELKIKEVEEKAVILETLQDLPSADIKPKENALFICKLNPITTEEDLSIIFYRFGNCKCKIIKNSNGESLCYGFIEFDNVESCEEAYLKMDNTIIDDRRIHIDFSQSVSREGKSQKKRKKNQNFTKNKLVKK